MELDLRSLFGLHVLYSLAETPQHPPPAFGLIYEGTIGQPISLWPLIQTHLSEWWLYEIVFIIKI